MKTSHLIFVSTWALAGLGLRAQTADTQPPPAPPGSGISAYSYGGGLGYAPPLTLAGSVSVPYATKWDATGIIADLGAQWRGGSFLGGEASYYGGDDGRVDVFSDGTYPGHFYSRQNVTTLDLVYRFTAPLWRMGDYTPIAFYAGAGGGVGFVNYSNSGYAFGFHNDNSGNWTGELMAGLQFHLARNLSGRLGYRYVMVSDAWQFDQRANLDSNVVEAGLTFRF